MESMEGDQENGGSAAARRVEIDTSSPFRSVKEAIMLFGERVLVGEIYANRINEIKQAAESKNEHHGSSRMRSLMAELEETRRTLEKEREENQQKAHHISTLQEELRRAKMDLEQLQRDQKEDLETHEDFKFVERVAPEIEIEIEKPNLNLFLKKRCVTFASPPSLSQVLNAEDDDEMIMEKKFFAEKGRHEEEEEEGLSMKKKKKKKKMPLVPLIGAFILKKKSYQDVACMT
ncbi:WEB family protein At2g17940-like isoform X2 [Ananas comosus]|nr:WEB family protein At2g17940-like isoform X2 [Ananas comosus]